MLQFFASIAATHTLRVESRPDIACTFNTKSVELEANKTVSLSAYTQTGFKFLRWEDESGATVSTQSYFTYTMPDRDVLLTAVCEYNPDNPANPAKNYWNKETGEVIIDDFTPGSLSSAISSAISGSNRNDVKSIIVSGIVTNNDLGIANNYTQCSFLDLSRVTGITDIPSYAFDYTNLETVILPHTIEKIGYEAFYQCASLTALTIYAMTPPTLENYVFYGVPDGLVVYVPAAAIQQYEEAEVWKDIIILPIQEDIRNITISLPNGADVADYSQMWLELTNLKSGQRIHYVMTDRQTYTFANIIRNTSWKVTIRNERGDVFGQIDKVEVKDEDVAVSFTSLFKPQTVSLTVLLPDGTDVTDKAQVTWLDAEGSYLTQSYSLASLPFGSSVSYRVVLSQELAMQYVTPLAADYVVNNSNNHVQIKLEPIKQITLSGSVKDAATNTSLNGAIISASQTFGGKYSRTVSTKSDAKGNYSLTASNVPTLLAFSASDYISQTIVCDSLLTGAENVSLPDVSLKEISGAVISLNLTYTKCPTEAGNGDTFQEWYADYNNITYGIYNQTKQKSINEFNVQYPHIVLLEEVDEGDILQLTATSTTGAFMPVLALVTIDKNQRADVVFNIVELGKIRATFSKNSNATVVGSLYDVNGKLVKTYDYTNASLTIDALPDGTYTLVTMGSSKLFNNIYDLNQLPQTGLVKGTDYTQASANVQSGKVCAIDIDQVPTLNESKLYYTGENTSFTVNKSSIVAGNYLTLTGHLDFKSAYAGKVCNVKLIVDLPESCEFVENSVMVGNNTSSYTLQNNRITIPMACYSDRVRFCVIPTLGGEYAPSALAQFDIDGETINQPIGSANYTVKDLSISVPTTVAKTTIPVSGTAVGVSSVEIYDGDALIGQTTSLANGTWSTTCELNEPYNLSEHTIYAKVTTKSGMVLTSETVNVVYNMYNVVAEKVTMLYYNPEMNKEYNIVFDLINGTVTPSSFYFFPYKNWPNWSNSGTEPKDFTFIVDLSNNDTTVVKDVTFRIYTKQNRWMNLKAAYDQNKERWTAIHKFEESNLPTGVKVNIDCANIALADRSLIDKLAKDIEDGYEKASNLKQEYDSLLIECEIIDIENQNVVSAIDSLLAFYSNDDPITKIDSIIVEILRLSDPDFNENDIDLSPVEYESVSELINAAEELLKDTLEIDMDYYLDYFSQIDIFLEGDTLVDYSQMFTERNEKISFIDIDGDMHEVYHISRYDIDWAEWTDSDLLDFGTTQGDSVYVYLQGKNVLVLDCKTDSAWVVQGTQLVNQFAREIRNALFFSDVLDVLHEAIRDVSLAVSTAMNAIDELAKPVKEEIQNLENAITKNNEEITKLWAMRYEKNSRITKIEKTIKSLDVEIKTPSDEAYLEKCKELKKSLERERAYLWEDRKFLDSNISRCEKQLNLLNSRKILKVALVAQFVEVGLLLNELCSVIKYGNYGITDYNKWTSFINSIKCEEDKDAAERLIDLSKSNRDRHCRGYAGAMAISGIAASVTGFMQFNAAAKAAKFVVKFVTDMIADFLSNTAKNTFEDVKNNSQNDYNARKKDKQKLKCHKDDDDDDDDDNDDNDDPPYPTVDPIHDPSGFVYEGVFSNRVEGVTAICFYKEEVEDMYGDFHENIVKWDAEAYAQENPLFTDANGFYRWDVPQGLWQVKFEKDGYETTYSEWLPVPPPQLDVNIAMTQNRQPEVKMAHAYEDAVEVEFDKYMMPELLTTDNIIVMQGNKQVAGSVELLNEEVSYEGSDETFASKVRFNAAAPFTEQEVTLIVNNRVKSYAGIRMQDNFQQTFSVEKEIKQIVCDSLNIVVYGEETILTISVLPAIASKGKTLNVQTSSAMILGIDTDKIVIDNEGKAEINITGYLPGVAGLSFSVEGTDKTATAIVKVIQLSAEVAMPKASILSGSVIARGTSIVLSCTTADASIYYTLDGSCPCDEDSRLLYTGPIIINRDLTIKAMAIGPDGKESGIAEFTYSVESSGIESIFEDSSIQIYPSLVEDYLTINAHGQKLQAITLTSMNGATVVFDNLSDDQTSIDVHALPSGPYAIEVITDAKSINQIVIKK